MVADAIRLLLFPALMAFAASSDLVTMTISNRVSLVLIAAFFVLAIMWSMPLFEIGTHVGAAAAVLVVSFTFFARGWIGGGYAKLAAATALFAVAGMQSGVDAPWALDVCDRAGNFCRHPEWTIAAGAVMTVVYLAVKGMEL